VVAVVLALDAGVAWCDDEIFELIEDAFEAGRGWMR
jgi:hypothetical protein